jgi:hypothetical protein
MPPHGRTHPQPATTNKRPRARPKLVASDEPRNRPDGDPASRCQQRLENLWCDGGQPIVAPQAPGWCIAAALDEGMQLDADAMCALLRL